ncbi:PQQ-binding-like beta-propeller repeat protein [Actinomadura xylanilytica]|uniref:outer membrane protein assembly factor BamB family protein n=1 Tax=Actinomadura xylanilytica TaxID=887459 RepID=UPI00255A9A11|nr:PQQ-binding-like beta-propeller repeat protein [Actinomadura xylanilytica]MDL4772596.1 PQQ-binding-like beta-propeller repeat protein [Actinomadura xylanilytica]
MKRPTTSLLAALTSAFLLVSCTAPAEDEVGPAVRAVRTTAGSGVPPLSETGPAPGGLQTAWRLGGDRGHSVVDGQLVIAKPEGIEVRDVRTGKVRWHYAEIRRHLIASTVTGGAILVATGSRKAIPDRWVSLDAATGKVNWTKASQGFTFPSGMQTRAAAAAGVVPALNGFNARILKAIDLRTGHVRWATGKLAASGCVIDTLDTAVRTVHGDDSLFLVPVGCGSKRWTIAVDPATGAERWRHAGSTDDAAEATVHNGVTQLTTDSKSLLLDANGRELLRDGSTCQGECAFYAAPDRVFISRDRLLAIDRRTSKQHSLPLGPYSLLTMTGDRLYGLRDTIAPGLLAPGLDTIDPATGDATTMPMPLAVGHHRFGSTAPAALRVAGGRAILTLRDTADMNWSTSSSAPLPRAHGPAELGGVPVADWPDACKIAPSVRPPRYLDDESEDAHIGPVKLTNVTCNLDAPSGTSPVTLTVAWVARTPELAKAYLPTAPLPENTESVHLGDDAFRTKDGIIMRSGRYIFRLTGTDTTALARKINQAHSTP